MKQIIATVAITATLIFLWFGLKSNYIKAWTRSDFFDPISSIPFDVHTRGETARVLLNPKHVVTHAFSLSFPAEIGEILNKDVLDGRFGIVLSSNGTVIFSGSATPPQEPISGYRNNEKKVVLFFMDLPLKEFPENLALDISVEEPMTALSDHQGEINFEVFPHYTVK